MSFSSFRSKLHAFLKMFPVLIQRLTKPEKFFTVILVLIILISSAQLLIRSWKGIILENQSLYAEGLVGTPRILNPLFAEFNDVDRDLSALLFSGLMKYDPSQAQFVLDLAKEVSRSEDNLTYTFTIREDAKWHDDTPVTADDVYFTFHDIVQDPGFKNPFLKSAFSEISISKTDDRKISFTLQKPNSYFISYLITGILPKHILGETAVKELEKDPFNKKPIGTGPYMYPKSTPALPDNTTQIVLNAFYEYYGVKPSVSSMRFSFFPSMERMIKEKNTLSGIPKLPASVTSESFKDPRFTLHQYSLPQYMALFLNMDRPLIKEKRFRQGLLISIDKEKLALDLGNITPIDTVYGNKLPEEWVHSFSPTGTAKILSEYGFSKKGAGEFLMDSKGQTLALSLVAKKFPDGTPQEIMTKNIIEFLKNSFKESGIRIDLTLEADENFQTLVQKREYDLLLSGQSLGYNTDLFSFWHSSQAEGFGLNLSQLKSFRVDSLLEDLRLMFNIDQKKKKLLVLEKLISDESPAIFLFSPVYSFALDNKITDFPYDNYAFPSDRFAKISDISIDKKNVDIKDKPLQTE